MKARIRLFDGDGKLADNCREIASLFAADSVRVARRFWTHFGNAPEVGTPFEGAAMDEMVAKILPYLAAKYSDVGGQKWADMVGTYVEEATEARISLTTLISSISAAAEEGQHVGSDIKIFAVIDAGPCAGKRGTDSGRRRRCFAWHRPGSLLPARQLIGENPCTSAASSSPGTGR